MSPTKELTKHKALELFNKYIYYAESFTESQQIDNAKKCALICVDEIFNHINLCYLLNNNQLPNYMIDFWTEVRKQIEQI